MQDIFDITEKEIQELSDSNLRTLIGLLCEAELERNDLPVTAAKCGGNQRAADGGLDVYVDLENPTKEIGEIPRWKTGIQVKQESMPKSKIKKEMSQDGTPKPILAELACNKGAYLIACGRDTNSDKMLRDRLEAMAESCESIPEKDDLHLDFFDSSRIATWTRKHPSLTLWVKAKLGSNTNGWQPHDNWSECPNGIDGKFILDDSSKIYDDRSKDTDGLSAEHGLNRIRTLLHEERSCIRLAGLSGVGKTRFAQALYDERIGQAPLPKSIACYTDIAHSPSPTPRDMALQLIALNKRAILIVDNCPPDLHDELSKVCTRADSKISLLTIEYDIRDDKPERTDVFRMEPSSSDLIEKLISSRFKDINNLGARRIAEFSEGNARIAIALAETFEKGDAILTLENNELFKRLFHQRNAEDDSLIRAAEVLSLVYSFDGETLGIPESELDKLGKLAGMPAMELYRHVATLLKRGLAQKRSKWRAVLPHAIASRLAKQALENIPAQFITDTLAKDKSHRLLKSYTRRLGYLHDCEAAQGIVKSWLQPGGGLDDITTLGKRGIESLKNIAPVAQEETLEAIERAAYGPEGNLFASRNNAHHAELTRLLRKLAYKASLFKRCCRILLKFAATEKTNEKNNSIIRLTTSLFSLYLSGTCATIDQRLEILSECTANESPFQSIAAPILEGLLQSYHFSSSYSFEFGATSRGFGYEPENAEEVAVWYVRTIKFAQEVILENGPCSESFKIILSNNFRQLWNIPVVQEALETCTKKIILTSFWKDGWCAIRQTLHYDKDDFNQNSLQRLKDLEHELAPTNIYEQAQVYAFTPAWDMAGVDDFNEDKIQKVDEYTEELGRKVIQDDHIFQKMLPELVTHTGNIHVFGIGLAKGSNDPTKTWNQLLLALSAIPEEKRNVDIFSVFLKGMYKCDREWYEETLNTTVANEHLAPYFPFIQLQNKIDIAAAERLLKSLNLNIANVSQYLNLCHGQKSCSIKDETLAHILGKISRTKEGKGIALQILHMRYYNEEDFPLDESLLSFGQKLSINTLSSELKHSEKRFLRSVVKRSFAHVSARQITRELCCMIRQDLENTTPSIYDRESYLYPLTEIHPQIVLDEILLKCKFGHRELSCRYFIDKTPILHAPVEDVLEWCEIDPKTRYPLISMITPLFIKDRHGKITSTPRLTATLLDNADDYPEILKHLEEGIYPGGWTGKLSRVLGQRIPLLESLQQHEQKKIKEWSASVLERLLLRIEKEKKYEANEDRGRHESFE